MAKIYVSVTVPPGCMSGIKIEWDKDRDILKAKRAAARKADDRLRIEIFEVDTDLDRGDVK